MKITNEIMEMMGTKKIIKSVAINIKDGGDGYNKAVDKLDKSGGSITDKQDKEGLISNLIAKKLDISKDTNFSFDFAKSKGDKIVVSGVIIDEAQHYNTKIRQLEGAGSRKIRLGVKQCVEMSERMLNPNNNYPNPADELGRIALLEGIQMMNMTMKKLKSVKDKKGKKQ